MSIVAKLPTKLRKAAILISTLDTASADKLLDQMSPEQASRIRRALMELEDDVNAVEQETVIREFLNRPSPELHMEAGVELDPSILRHMASSPPAQPPSASPVVNPDGPFRFLHEAATDAIGRLLQREHPQVAAVVLSHLPPEKAANILVMFPADLQAAVLRRVAELDSADPEVLRDLEAELQTLLADQMNTGSVRRTGLTAVQSILRAADTHDRKDILQNLQRRDGDLAIRLQRSSAPGSSSNTSAAAAPLSREAPSAPLVRTTEPTFAGQPANPAMLAEPKSAPAMDVSFNDVTQLSSTDLAKLFHRCDPQVTLLALTGADEAFVEKLLAQLPIRDAKLLRRRMQQLGPILLRDVERAQQRLAEVAARMASEGLIQIEARGFAAAA